MMKRVCVRCHRGRRILEEKNNANANIKMRPDPNHVHMWCEIGIKSGLCFSVNGQIESSFVKHCVFNTPNCQELYIRIYLFLSESSVIVLYNVR